MDKILSWGCEYPISYDASTILTGKGFMNSSFSEYISHKRLRNGIEYVRRWPILAGLQEMEAPTKETKTETPNAKRPAMLGLGRLRERIDLHKVLLHPVESNWFPQARKLRKIPAGFEYCK